MWSSRWAPSRCKARTYSSVRHGLAAARLLASLCCCCMALNSLLRPGRTWAHCIGWLRLVIGLWPLTCQVWGVLKKCQPLPPLGSWPLAVFLEAVVEALQLGPPVVISPSLSGMYSLPFVTAPGSQLRGYVPVAPICTDKINAADYAAVKTPALIVYGDQDPMGHTSFEHLKQIPNHRVLVLKGAGHPCYLDKPEEWHTGLLDFLQGLA